MARRNKASELNGKTFGVKWIQRLLNDFGECPLDPCIEAVEWEVAHDPVDERLHARCREAALGAYTIRSLREQVKRIGFVPLPISEYVALLCRGAGVTAEPVLRWAGVTDIAKIETDAAHSIARLALALGIGLRQLVVHMRLALIQGSTSFPVGALARARRSATDGATSMSVSAYESFLKSVEDSLDDEQQRSIGDIVRTVRNEYLRQQKEV